MLLQRLKEYGARLELPSAGYGKLQVRYLINLDRQGGFLSLVDLATGTRGREARGVERQAPQLRRAGDKIIARLLVDNGEYVLGIGREKSPAEKVAMRHQAFVNEVRTCAVALAEPAVLAVLHFLEALPGSLPPLPAEFDPEQNVSFAVEGNWPIALASVQAYWAGRSTGNAGADAPAPKGGRTMTCLVCGNRRPAVERLPVPIKGIPGGQTTGMPLISANEDAYESYGLKASQIAPICHECAEITHKAANALIEGYGRTAVKIGQLLYIAWTREDVGFSWSSFITDPQPEEVHTLLQAPLRGDKRALAVDPTPFYAAALTASGARVVVRDWIDSTVGTVCEHLGRYFTLQRMVGADGAEGRPLGIWPLAMATVREQKDLSPLLPVALLRTALAGTPLPWWILYQAIRRNRAEQRLTYARAALIKMVLLSTAKSGSLEGDLVTLQADSPNRAYQCGRLFATLESIQRNAMPGIKATLVDRYFGAASTAPATVLGPLVRNAQAHLSKLRKVRTGAYVALSQRLEEIMAQLADHFPPVLVLEEQGRFALGYYHQRAHDRAAARARVQTAGGTADAAVEIEE